MSLLCLFTKSNDVPLGSGEVPWTLARKKGGGGAVTPRGAQKQNQTTVPPPGKGEIRESF